MKKQLIENQKGEVEFRKKLYLHQVENKAIFDDELMRRVLKTERVNENETLP